VAKGGTGDFTHRPVGFPGLRLSQSVSYSHEAMRAFSCALLAVYRIRNCHAHTLTAFGRLLFSRIHTWVGKQMLFRTSSGGNRSGSTTRIASGTKASKRSGTAAVEFAVILPFVMVLFLGIIEFGRVLMVQQILTNAAREGCRYAVLPGGTISSTRTVVTSYLSNANIALTNPTTQVTVSPDPTTATKGSSITVSVTLPFSSVSWLPGTLFMTGKSLSSSVVMRLESNNT